MSINRTNSKRVKATKPGPCECGLGKGALRGHPSWCPASFPLGWDPPFPDTPDSTGWGDSSLGVCPV